MAASLRKFPLRIVRLPDNAFLPVNVVTALMPDPVTSPEAIRGLGLQDFGALPRYAVSLGGRGPGGEITPIELSSQGYYELCLLAAFFEETALEYHHGNFVAQDDMNELLRRFADGYVDSFPAGVVREWAERCHRHLMAKHLHFLELFGVEPADTDGMLAMWVDENLLPHFDISRV
ncbi:MAG: hypothetical protein EBR88_09265 [Betaproteobacteria bacterium]|nr:hypothetical protein [Betaproteobacteria bacterium]